VISIPTPDPSNVLRIEYFPNINHAQVVIIESNSLDDARKKMYELVQSDWL
jgi:hypothetical protein